MSEVVALLPIAVLGALICWWWPRREAAVPGSGRWVAGLRVVVDLVFGALLMISLIAAGSSLFPGSLVSSFGNERLSVTEQTIEMTFLRGRSDAVGKPVPASELAERRDNAGRGFDVDDDDLGRTREEFGSDARLFADQRVVIASDDPGVLAWIAAITTLLLGIGTVLLGLWSMRSLLVLAGRGRPFHPRSVFWLRLMAGAVVVNVVSAAIGAAIVGRLITAAGGGTGHVPFDLDASWLWAAFILLALSEIWRSGIALQRDAEATV